MGRGCVPRKVPSNLSSPEGGGGGGEEGSLSVDHTSCNQGAKTRLASGVGENEGREGGEGDRGNFLQAVGSHTI